jgi:hypothetical protein
MIGRYQIYPAWFGGAVADGMRELAQREARRLDRVVTSIDVVGSGENERGDYINFDVTYSAKILVLEQSS